MEEIRRATLDFAVEDMNIFEDNLIIIQSCGVYVFYIESNKIEFQEINTRDIEIILTNSIRINWLKQNTETVMEWLGRGKS